MKFKLSEVAAALDVASGGQQDALVTGWSIDSRTLQPGDLFFALRGPNHDGHAHLAEVFAKGAVAAVVDSESQDPRALRVPDSLGGLQRLAGWARQQWGGDMIAVTGSAGKTTTKDVIAQMLAVQVATAKNEGNLNNHIGLPLSLLRLDAAARAAVLEMGMNHPGEIRALAAIARPRVGVVTNVGYAHIENFDSIEGIAAAKRELIESLGESGTAVLNADDPRVAAMAKIHPGRAIFYGRGPLAEVRAEEVDTSVDGMRFRVGAERFETSLTGGHNLSNLLAGIAVADVFGIALQRLRDTIRNFTPGKMRGEKRVHRGVTIYDDCYNSNPEAARAMLDVLRETPARRRIAVLGEMLELGHLAGALHREVGAYASRCGIDVLVGIRGAASDLLDAAMRAGLRASAAFFFEDSAEAGRFVRGLAAPGDAILFKGSRGVHVERALQEFLAPSDLNEGHGV